uniref:Uncharacterized protein n=1 Tax=Cyprinus carpio TaxID=7962 RepID=A0A8C2DAP7_CYPCA
MFSSGKVVELFYDVVSPYSWLRNIWNINLKFKPAFLTGVIYMNHISFILFFLLLSVAFLDSLNVMCFVTAVAEKGKEGDTLERVSRELWTRKWHTHQDITHILRCLKSQLIKDKLKSVKEEALFYPFLHCFGFLFIVCHVNGKAKVFVGSDGFELMAYFIGNYY